VFESLRAHQVFQKCLKKHFNPLKRALSSVGRAADS